MAIALPERYSSRPPFTEGQVKTTMKELGYAKAYEEVALLLFCDEAVYEKLGLDGQLKQRWEGYRERAFSSAGGEGSRGGDGGGGGD
tara:strand:+ start:119 stop:379 length:261 start_codon:yes stop_codon:yes gene_type:complete